MRRKMLLFAALCVSALLSGQTPSPVSTFLNVNNCNALIYSESSFFWDHIGMPAFEIPMGSGKHTVYCHDIWIGGKDSNDSLHLAAQKYMANGKDYFFGPVADNYDNNYDTRYNTVWKVSQPAINNHILNYGSTGYVTPSSIANWPGNGDVSNGEPAYLAPYVDVNTNGIYDPDNGDYPYIKGDQALYVIFNDARSTHMETGGDSLRFDIHAMVYGFYATGALYNTVFISYKIVNRSSMDYHDLRVGMFTDFNIGSGFDDYVGCDTLRNLYYGYNGDSVDGDGNGGTYGTSPPAQGVVFLNEPMCNFIWFNSNAGQTGDPSTAVEYYNYLQSKWKDGTALTYGGIGYGGAIHTNYMFPGDINNSTAWSEVSEGNTPEDRRGLASIEVGDFLNNDEFCFDIAFVWGRSTNNSVDTLKSNVDIIQNYYETNNLGCQWWPTTDMAEIHNRNHHIEVYPNPAWESVNIQTEEKVYAVSFIDITGKVILQTTGKNIDVQNIIPGMYIINIETENNNYKKKIFIR